MAMPYYELEELLVELGKIRGQHTELVTVMIPADSNINVVAKQIEAEKSTAVNIKSKTTRKNVVEALDELSKLRNLALNFKGITSVYEVKEHINEDIKFINREIITTVLKK